MNLIFGFLLIPLALYFADEKAAWQAAHDFCPDTFVERVGDRSYFECEGVRYVVSCDDGECDLREIADDPTASRTWESRQEGDGV